MNNPAHNNGFNKDTERVDREKQLGLQGLMNTSREWDEAAEEASKFEAHPEQRDVAEKIVEKREETAAKIETIVQQPTHEDDPSDGLSYNEDIRWNFGPQGSRE